MSIATKKGDKGETSLFTGERISKADLRVEVYGTSDELIVFIGNLRVNVALFENELIEIQKRLYKMNSYFASKNEKEKFLLTKDDVDFLDNLLNKLENEFGKVEGFILPSESKGAALCDICRVVCRRLERRAVAFSRVDEVDTNVLKFINRLSDVFFMMARVIGKREKGVLRGFN
ncbi:cob(I)yrinic acid a,c-diamide adenosyltransferase [Deferribacteraceae bacterium V6Fe1]|nr:cob(I)yrinic acid a,c-diamide adenosyltransferase [Deferribacteraceae bacterium V6Fe1]